MTRLSSGIKACPVVLASFKVVSFTACLAAHRVFQLCTHEHCLGCWNRDYSYENQFLSITHFPILAHGYVKNIRTDGKLSREETISKADFCFYT